MKYITYYLRLLWHWVATLTAYIARGIGCLPFAPEFFNSLWASYVVGASSDRINKKQFDSAFKILRSVENYEIDDVWVAAAQYQLAELYRDGNGVEKSEEKAFSLFQKAASAGNSDAISYMRRQNAILRGKNPNQHFHPTQKTRG